MNTLASKLLTVQTAKKITSLIVGAGTTSIVSSIVKNNTDPENVAQKVNIAAASTVLGFMAADATKSYTDDKIDALVIWWKENISEKDQQDQTVNN